MSGAVGPAVPGRELPVGERVCRAVVGTGDRSRWRGQRALVGDAWAPEAVRGGEGGCTGQPGVTSLCVSSQREPAVGTATDGGA